MIKKGTWVEIEEVVLTPDERSTFIPEETKKTPLMVWIRGNCLRDCNMGEIVRVETLTGRIMEGKVVEEEPGYDYGFGKYVEEIAFIGKQAREMLLD